MWAVIGAPRPFALGSLKGSKLGRHREEVSLILEDHYWDPKASGLEQTVGAVKVVSLARVSDTMSGPPEASWGYAWVEFLPGTQSVLWGALGRRPRNKGPWS